MRRRVCRTDRGAACARRAASRARRLRRWQSRDSTLQFREDHPAGGGLEHRSHFDADLLALPLASVLDDDHRTVIEEADALVLFLAFLDDADSHLFARKSHGFHGVAQLVDVEDTDALELRDAIEVVVVRQDPAAAASRERDE